ncbi:pleckstrin homology domain-containing family G member 4B isoform X6 [Electrophorus electricus]|uniref:pleckstrin homology domain-containing family G member 4B isoform X6 n=1 Tax=Electrophorus electricus TaxID=8005 RepID=UPI0015CFA8E9|nr:pleckstrin homology domain-containing family G member 4B isoform X6 [Electrophorus electricus]
MQDSESLDSCIQNTLATLYPPFGATSSTVLCQVLDVVESAYRGDGLHYLISFLVPTKRVLQNLQQDACFPYCGFLFRHEGWPLCIHEKIIVQLSSLDRRVLRPGDFYLQVLASAKSPPHIALRCLSASGQHVEEVVVPELAYTSLFTMAWLDSINQERGGDGRAVLEHCLLSADNDVFRVPWEDVVHPEFISRPPNADQSAPEYSRIKDLGEALGSGVEHSCTDNTAMSGCGILTDASMGQSEEREIQSSAYRLLPAMAQSGRSSCTSEDSEGEYVELEEIELPCFSPQKGSLTQSISLTHRNLQQSWATGPVQMPPGAAPCQGPGRNSARSQSMVCTALIKENLSESLQPHVLTHSMVEELPCQPHVTRARECIRAEDRALCPISVSPSVSPVCVRNQPVLSEAQNISPDVLSSGVLCLPGTRDKSGRALVTVALRNTAWLNPDCNSVALMRIMVYYYSTLRKEVQALGLTILVDARRCSPVPALFKACHILQEAKPGCIHTLLLLADRDLALRLEKPSTFQVELLSSLKALHKHVDVSQLPTEFDGTFPFCHASWLYFRTRLEQLSSDCEDAVNLLQTTISSLESRVLPSTAEGAEALLCKYKELMQCVLEDSRLVRLQQEGGAALSRLRKEETSVSLTEDYRDAIESVGGLYNHVDELVHRLVMLSNKCTQELEFVMEFKTLEEGFREVSDWIDEVGEGRLRTLGELEDSLEQLQRKQTLFRDFYTAAYEHCKSGEALLSRLERWEDVSSAELQVYEVKVRSFWVHLHDFSQRVEDTKEKINKTVRLYEFFDKAYEWALEGMRHLACISMEDCNTPEKSQGVIGCLETYRGQHPSIPDARFQEMKDLAGELRSDQGLKQWKFAWSKCQETKQMFEKKLEAALRARRSLPAGDEPRQAASSPRRHSDSSTPQQERSGSLSFSGWARERFSSISSSSSTPCSRTDLPKNPTWSPFHPEHRIPHRTCLSSHWLTRSTSSESAPTRTSCTFSPCLPSLVETKRRVLRKTQSFDATAGGEPVESRYGTCQRTLSEPARRGNTGVFIRGLEVSSTEVVDRPYSPRLAPAHGWVSMDTHREGSPAPEPRTKGSKLRHIVDEMVTTEREYVRSLRYIIEHYFPEMERRDLPQDLRGKRSVIFGNLEKLVDFHSQYFLKELESCCNHPLRVSHCFLRHQDQFGMYALYSKNKPKSDTLLASHGNTFFRNKQLELEDKMDLASYLLKPIQRMSKYALLLKDLIKEVSDTQEQEHSYLCAATEMVKFQLRHGNDLLAMDAIRDCDVNLKEQGQLVRQDEFTIWYGRKKTQRHIFLFEDLVLFSKPKRIEGGLDVYIYKHSFKTADVGMTETSGDSGLRFEIWFRRRTSKNQTYILQASTSDIKHAWTSDIARILWQQATRNKEIRMQEMVSMGVGNKPFLDIKPSDAAINDRAIDYIMKGRGARTRASIAVSLFDHSNPFKRAAVAGAGGPPSSTLLGPLNLHMYSSQTLLHGERPLISPCIEEDELENETSSQPSMTTESSGSSSHCLSGSGSSGSDSGCVSSHLPEPPCEEPSFPCDSTSLSSIASPSNQKPRFNSQYISAKAAQVIGPSTVV